MKIKLILLFLVISLLPVLGCSDLSKVSVSDYYEVYASSSTDGYTTSYALTITDSSSINGYNVAYSLPNPAITLHITPKGSLSIKELPMVTFNTMKVTYSIVSDTQGVLGTWTPTTIDTSVNLVISGTSSSGSGEASSSSAIFVLNNISSSALAREVYNKICSVTTTLKADATYDFTLVLSTGLIVKADVLLSGIDNYGKEQTLRFSTNLYFTKE